MEEDLIKKIFYQYLCKLSNYTKLNNYTKLINPPKIKSQSSPGPDFIMEGKAYECKGTKFDEKNLFSQLLSYGLQYSQIGLIIPYDALNFKLLWKLEALEKFLEKSIEIYLIASYGEKNYAVYCWSSARMLNSEISSILYYLGQNFKNIPIEEKEKKIINFLDAIETQIKEEFKKYTIDKAKNAKSIWEGALINLDLYQT